MLEYKRGSVWLADLDPVIGLEEGKTRPVLVVQNDVANQYSPVVIVAAITTSIGSKEYPTEVLVNAPEGGLRRDSAILLNQIRTIDKRRLIERWGDLGDGTMERVDRSLEISLGLTPV